jgi:hypothetical protein
VIQIRRTIAALHVASAWLLVAVIVVQVFLAGLALANLGGSGDFSLHVEFGYTIVGLVALATVVTAVLAGCPRRDTLAALGLLILYVVQTSLPNLRAAVPALAALHPVNALLLFGLAVWYARHAQRLRAAGWRHAMSAGDTMLEGATR